MIGAGTYAERAQVGHSGAPGKPIVFRAAPGAQPVLDGSGIPMDKDEGLFEIFGVSHIRVIGLHLVYNGLPGHRKEGICLKDGSSRGTVHGNWVHRVRGAGIYVDAWDKHTFDIEIYGNGIALASEMGGCWSGSGSITTLPGVIGG